MPYDKQWNALRLGSGAEEVTFQVKANPALTLTITKYWGRVDKPEECMEVVFKDYSQVKLLQQFMFYALKMLLREEEEFE